MEIDDIDFLSFLELDVENEINKNDSDDDRVEEPPPEFQIEMDPIDVIDAEEELNFPDEV